MATLKGTDVELYYEQAGQGPPVLFIQGVGVVGECWRPQADDLARHFQTALFDNRGIGKSARCTGPITIEAMARDARGLMDELGWESAHVVGHSMGGVIAQQLALDDPRRVRSLSLLCTFDSGKNAARLTPWVLWMTLRTRLGSRAMRRRAFLEMLWPAADLERANINPLAEQVGALIGRDLAQQPPVLMKQVRALARHDISGRLGELTGIPSLVLSAAHDPIAPPKYGRALAGAIPGARFELMPGASHGITIQNPEKISALLKQFLGGVEKQRESLPLPVERQHPRDGTRSLSADAQPQLCNNDHG